MELSKFDLWLFVGEKAMCIVYVDAIIFWSKNEQDIHDIAMNLRSVGVDLEQEDDTSGLLGVTMCQDKDTNLTEMKQTGLIDQIIEVLGLDDGIARGKYTPAKATPLVKDECGDEASGTFSYISVIGMLLYLSGHSCPDITYAVNYCARYMLCPKHSHEVVLKQICHYLKLTREYGLVMNPNSDMMKIDCYPDADFSRMYGHEKPTDPVCVKCWK